MAELKTRTIAQRSELIAHFDESAPAYEEAHGDAERLLAYRLGIIRTRCLGRSGVFLEIGCGTAMHLLGMAAQFSRLIGTDISPGMIEAAQRKVEASPYRERIELRVDPAEELRTVDVGSVDVVLCVGSFEHMLERDRVVRQVARVLKAGGLFVLLTPNGRYCWYRFLAPAVGIPTRHLSTDRFLDGNECAGMLRAAGLRPVAREFWTFIPKGDMPRWCGGLLHALDYAGRACRVGIFRGGLLLTGIKGS